MLSNVDVSSLWGTGQSPVLQSCVRLNRTKALKHLIRRTEPKSLECLYYHAKVRNGPSLAEVQSDMTVINPWQDLSPRDG